MIAAGWRSAVQDQPPGASSLAGRLLGHYRLVERIGAGGMGEVYRARDEHLHRDVAVKVLPHGSLRDERARHRLRNEALALSRLNHPNIATVHDFDSQDGIDFLVMEFVAGTPVDVLPAGRQAEAQIVALAVQFAEGLAAAHEQGVLHRDLKPANLRLTASGQLKILDFGLADLVAPLDDSVATMTAADAGSAAGTLPYMAPEQLQGARPDTRTDIYAFGVVLYELATGRRPFTNPSSGALIGEIICGAPTAPRAARSDLSEGLESIILRCMEKDPARRYPTAKALLEDLRRCAAGAPPTARPVRARRAWGRSAVGVAAAVVLLLAFGLWRSVHQPALAFASRDWLVIADFENLTGEAVFDKALDTALRVSIEQSSYVNVVPRQRITDALLRMKKPGTARVDAALAREVAQREGFRAVLAPVISGVGGAYALSATLENPASGTSVKSSIVQASRREDVLPALDSLARSVRGDLGESMSALSPQAKPLSKVTTTSLEALRQYSLAIEKHREAKFDEARVYYENALRIDPGFASAQASLGMLEFERFDQKRGKDLLAQVVGRLDGLGDNERYRILAFHARAVENDLPKAVEQLRALAVIYPDNSATHNNIAFYSRQLGRFEDAVKEYREAIRVDPTSMLFRDGLAGTYLYSLGDAKAGIETCRAELALNNSHFQAWQNLGLGYLGAGDFVQAQAAMEKALQLNPKSTIDLYRLGSIHRLRGEYPAAEQAFLRVLDINPDEVPANYEVGVVYRLMKRDADADERFKRFRAVIEKDVKANPKDANNYLSLALVSLRLGQPAKADALMRKSVEIDASQHFGLAMYFSVRGKRDEAVKQLELAVKDGFRNYIWLTIHVDLDNLRAEPRFQALLNRLIKR
jgi:tetratricopeptide (TPR) repeat protein/tRNA A-37 threonylcarbamoyl transferase component Bud32